MNNVDFRAYLASIAQSERFFDFDNRGLSESFLYSSHIMLSRVL